MMAGAVSGIFLKDCNFARIESVRKELAFRIVKYPIPSILIIWKVD